MGFKIEDSDNGTLAGLRDLLMKHQNGEDIHEAPKLNPEDEDKHDASNFLGDFTAHASTDSAGAQGYADGGDVDGAALMQQAAPMSAQPIDVSNGGTGATPFPMPSGVLPTDPNAIAQGSGPSYMDTAPTPSPINQTMQAAQGIPPTNPGIYQGISADDRAALLQKLLAAKASTGNMVASGAAGLGDAISNAFGKGGSHSQADLREAQNQNINTRIGAVDTQRQQRLQDLQANIAQQENDPASAYSAGMRNLVKSMTGKAAPSGASASQLKSVFPEIAKIMDSQLTSATTQRGQTLGVQEKAATMSAWDRLLNAITGNPAAAALEQTATGGAAQAPASSNGWKVIK
jgi:hypothetical protein